MRSEHALRQRLQKLEAQYDANDPPSSPTAQEREIELLRAIAELEWVLEERADPLEFPAT